MLTHCDGTVFSSLVSVGLVQPGSAGKSMSPSLSLSIPSEHCAVVSGASVLSVVLLQSGSVVHAVVAPGVPMAGENTSIVT